MKGDGIDVLGDRNCRTAAVDLSLRLSYGVREAAGVDHGACGCAVPARG